MKKLALSGLALGTALVAAGTAQAEPLTLATDQMEQVTAGGYFYLDADVHKDVHKRESLDVFKSVFAAAFIKGNIGDALAGSQAYGSNTLTETLTLTHADQHGYSDALSESLAAANGNFDYRPIK